MPTYAPTPAEIDSFVKRVMDWTDVLQNSADAVLARIKGDYVKGQNGATYAVYSAALEDNLAVSRRCSEVTNAASAMLLSIAESQLDPIAAASKDLADAAKHLETVTNIVKISTEVVGAAAAMALVFSAPSVATIAAAGSALAAAAQEIRTDAGL